MNNFTANEPNWLSINSFDVDQFLSILTNLSDDKPEKSALTYQLIADRSELPALVLDGDTPLAKLEEYNNQGYGIFVMINEGDGLGRTAANVERIRAVFVDMDGTSPEKLYSCSFTPTIIVESSSKRFHAYWMIKAELDEGLSEFSHFQKTLARYFDSDPQISDLCRVMRVPGFWHQKAEPFATRILHYDETNLYKLSDIRNWIKSIDIDLSPTAPPLPRHPSVQFPPEKGTRNDRFFRLCCAWQRKGLSSRTQLEQLREINSKTKPPLSDSELQAIVVSAARYAPDYSDDELIAAAILTPCDPIRVEKVKLPKNLPNIDVAPTVVVRPVKPKPVRATREKYWEFFIEMFGRLERDIFSDELMVFDAVSKIWVPVLNKEEQIKSALCVRMEQDPSIIYELGRVKMHLCAMWEAREPKLLADIPQWDGRDRINELVCRVDLDLRAGIDNEAFEQLMKDWHARLWDRLANPEIQNRLFVLSGPQKIGKDFWIAENVAAMGQFCNPLHVEGNDKDTRAQLHTSWVLTIAEFDRTARIESSTLKDLITADSSNIRLPFDRRHQFRRVRCSMAASCNVDDVLQDWTGNRRYMIFQVRYIDRTTRFSSEDRLQVLAQGRFLSESGFRADEQSEEQLQNYILRHTPTAPDEEVTDCFDEIVTTLLKECTDLERAAYLSTKFTPNGLDGFVANTSSLGQKVLEKLRKVYPANERRLQRLLKKRAARAPSGDRGYYFRISVREHEEDAPHY